MDGFLTVGQPAAEAAVRAMLASRLPHAVLLVGPASVGKHALALDLAAALLCTGASGADRPCRACRGCRMVEHGNHPDLHRLAPSGPGNQIKIGETDHPEPGTIRRLAADLALLPVEGGERVAVVRDAQRMNESAQSAFLKTLEEPPPATTLVLCVDDEELLLPTIRSRCARIRLGTLAGRDIERLLGERGLADTAVAARLARLAGGRPGLAVAYAAAPDAELVRNEIVATLLDLLGASRATRLGAAKELLGRAMTLAGALEPAPEPAVDQPARRRGRGKGPTPGGSPPAPEPAVDDAETADPTDPGGTPGAKASAADRRRALALLLDLWRDLARDLAAARCGAAGSVRDLGRLEEIQAAAAALPADAPRAALARLVRAGELLDVNAAPELLLDVLLLRWPRLDRAA